MTHVKLYRRFDRIYRTVFETFHNVGSLVSEAERADKRDFKNFMQEVKLVAVVWKTKCPSTRSIVEAIRAPYA